MGLIFAIFPKWSLSVSNADHLALGLSHSSDVSSGVVSAYPCSRDTPHTQTLISLAGQEIVRGTIETYFVVRVPHAPAQLMFSSRRFAADGRVRVSLDIAGIFDSTRSDEVREQALLVSFALVSPSSVLYYSAHPRRCY